MPSSSQTAGTGKFSFSWSVQTWLGLWCLMLLVLLVLPGMLWEVKGSRIPTLPVSGPGGEISSFQGSRIPSLPIGRPGSLFDPFGPARCWGRCMGLDALGRCSPQPLCFITFK
ncbi:uncharacterized protein LOC135092784 [Scylla paramamosain]|uniref:uncharacterized protein LOC135092784 n=1 Tax=Scylla paramamosain TaxID=85552 RepID=UPI00308272DE